MIPQSPLKIWLRNTVIGLVAILSWLWITAEDERYEQLEAERTEEILRYQQQRRATVSEPELEPEPELPEYREPEPENFGWIVPPEPVRKAAGKVKRKIKKSVQK